MELTAQETSLLELARRLNIEVRRQRFIASTPERSAGGLCLLRGRPVVLLDPAMAPIERVGVLCEALCAFDIDLDWMAEPVRRRLEHARRRYRGRKLLRRPVLRRVV